MMFDQLWVRRVLGALAAFVGAMIALRLQIPLPWLLGPLFCVAALRLSAAPVASFKPFQHLGQLIIGVSLGLYFTPEIVSIIAKHWLAILISTGVPLVLAAFGTLVFHRVGRTDVKTAWFASAIGGANEMSQLAERYGGRMDLVATSHSLRILAVVIVLPFGYQAFGVAGMDQTLLEDRQVVLSQLVYLIPAAVLLGYFAYRHKVPNAWVLGSLACTIALTVSGLVTTALPAEAINLGQVLIGWALGDRYRPAFFKAAPRFLLGVAIYTTGALVIAALVGLGLSRLSGIALATVWLGVAPGGLAEMAITAKVLMLGVPFVVAFQVIRMVFVVLITGPIYVHWIQPRENRRGP